VHSATGVFPAPVRDAVKTLAVYFLQVAESEVQTKIFEREAYMSCREVCKSCPNVDVTTSDRRDQTLVKVGH
jgi:hypothetical protein